MLRLCASAASLIALLAACSSRSPAATPPAPPPASLPRLDADTSLLVVSPHPDDETLCCAGVIQRVLSAGGHASIVWITSGDAEQLSIPFLDRVLLHTRAAARRLGSERMAEARAAATALGVKSDGQLFLGYPDGGVLALLESHRVSAYTARFTGAAAVPYADAVYPAHPYTGESLEHDFAAILERTQPTLILAPSFLDEHPDHRAAGLLAAHASLRSSGRWRVRYWIVHGGEGWPSPRGLLPGVPLTAPPAADGLVPAAFVLEPAEEDRKLLALQAHATQLRVMAPFLLSFVRTTELYFPVPATDTRAAPEPGSFGITP